MPVMIKNGGDRKVSENLLPLRSVINYGVGKQKYHLQNMKYAI